jgi:toxin ParE1/3/4
MKSAILSPKAQQDILEAIDWISRDNPDAALGLLRELEEALAKIGTHPLIGHHRPDLTSENYRFLTLAGYPYVVIYEATRSPPVAARILHGARDIPALLQDM